ncbi:hypothetical protein BT96DRAFT_1002285 [Gymnopus androsaceus JB14]|uniref:Uncharacterized protein n=1 Tax=Gymnopus androsaceus JB14 TaxID=1447944 RepID=A0A6A4GX24_9AGAR|nr:hypothetical protein BT96DRAFT_1002285 [Gymnopus androsaceus JB14]
MPSTFSSPSAAALRDRDPVFSSPTASDASSEAPSSLISFYSPVNIPVADDSNNSMARMVGSRYEDRRQLWSPKELFYFEYYDKVHQFLSPSTSPPFPETGSSLASRNIIRDHRNTNLVSRFHFNSVNISSISSFPYNLFWLEGHCGETLDNDRYDQAILRPFKVYSPGGFLYVDSYLDVIHTPCFEYQCNLGAGPHTHFSILGAHHDRREEYINRLPHNSPFCQDLAMRFVYEETADCLLGGEPVCLPITLYAYWRDSDLSFTEVYAAVRGFGFLFRYLIGPRLKTGVLRCAFQNMVNCFKVGFSDDEVGPDGKSLVATDFLVDCHSKQKFMHTLSRNIILGVTKSDCHLVF